MQCYNKLVTVIDTEIVTINDCNCFSGFAFSSLYHDVVENFGCKLRKWSYAIISLI